GGDENGAPPQPVDPDSGDESEQQERARLGGAEEAHLAGTRIERAHGREGQRQQGYLTARGGDGLGGPQFHERVLAKDATRSSWGRGDWMRARRHGVLRIPTAHSAEMVQRPDGNAPSVGDTGGFRNCVRSALNVALALPRAAVLPRRRGAWHRRGSGSR